MKKQIVLNAIILLTLAFVVTSCAKDSTTTTDSGTRAAFLGKWSVSESWTKLAYEVTIVADPNSTNGVFIYQFGNTGSTSNPASAVVNGTSIVLDADQTIGDGITINGSGNLSGTKINWNYTLLDGATLYHAVAIYTKQ
ncbi:MAG: hypothetical protein ACOYNC_05685 [Bacteroidales bacterium]